MNLDSLSFSLSQIQYLVTNLNKKNFKSSQSELQSLIESNGFEAERHLFRCLVSSIDFNAETLKTTGKDYHQTQLLRDLLQVYSPRPQFASLLCYSFENPLQLQDSYKLPSNLASQIAKLLKLNLVQEIAVALCLKSSSRDEIRKSSTDLLKQRIPELVELAAQQDQQPPSADSPSINDLPIDLLQQVLIEAHNTQSDYTDLVKKLFNESNRYASDIIQPVSSHNFNLNNLETGNHLKHLKMENSLVELIQELGFSFTSSKDECKNALVNICTTNNSSNSTSDTSSVVVVESTLTPIIVARILSMMIRTQSNTEQQDNWESGSKESATSSWSLDTFVQTVLELCPSLNWKDVVKEFDHPEFFVRDKLVLKQLVQALKQRVFKENSSFPIEHFYRVWRNPEGQISWIGNSLKHPDIFCFADYQCRRTATECLKAQPAEEDNKFIASWRSLNLLELLLNLSETGLYPHCVELFKLAIAQCSDLLLLGLLQTNTIWNKLKQELIGALIPIFLGIHPNSAVLLQYAWNQSVNPQLLRTIIMNAMTDWYMKAHDQEQNNRLSRILDVSQDLKALSLLLNGQPLIFNIDLACLAARRGYLKLDKWITDRIRDHGELFTSTVVAFLKRKVPALNPNLSKEEQQLQMANQQQRINNMQSILPETIQTILKCINASSSMLNAELQQEIYQMNMQARVLLDKQQTTPSTAQTTGTGGTGIVSNMSQQQTQNNPSQQAAAAAAIKSLVGASGATTNTAPGSNAGSGGNTFDMIQSMINLNLNPSAVQNPNLNLANSFAAAANSPSKILLSQLNPGLNLQGNSGIPNLNAQNLLLGANANTSIDNKISVLNNLLNNPNSSVRSQLNFGAGNGASGAANPVRSSLNSPQLPAGMEGMLDPATVAALGSSTSSSAGGYPKEIEEEVEKCIQSLFKAGSAPSLGVDDFVNLLVRLKDSNDKKDKDFYSYALQYILDANSCINRLDDMQLNIMSSIWGLLIDKNVLPTNLLSQILRQLSSMINKPNSMKYFVFAVRVLDKCKTRLKELSNFCQLIALSPHLNEIPRVIREFIDYGVRGMLPPSYQAAANQQSSLNTPQGMMQPALTPPITLPAGLLPQQQQQLLNKYMSNAQTQQQLQAAMMGSSNALRGQNVLPLSNPMSGAVPGSNTSAGISLSAAAAAAAVASGSKPSIANTTNIDTLLIAANETDSAHSRPVPPPESVQDRVGFIFNNLSLSNMQAKGDELRDVLKEDHWEWLAHYLVVKRVSIEPNFHALYSQFIDTLRKETLNEFILAETYRNIKVLLRSDKNDQKFSDRALLKNLGSWLGLITLAKGRPILHRDIDIKSLIVEAFQKGPAELLFVVPFVAKVLEPSGKSRVFAPPNPWLVSMLSVLVELHNEPDLKLNHKFEIEVLCKNLNLNINDIPIRGVLRTHIITEEQLTKIKSSEASSTTGQQSSTSSSLQPGSQQVPAQSGVSLMPSHLPSHQQQALQQVLFNQQASQDMVVPGQNDMSHMQAVAAQQQQAVAAAVAQQLQVQLQSGNAPGSTAAAATPGGSSAAGSQAAGFVPNPPKYKLTDIKLQSLQNNANLIFINPEIPLLNAQPTLKTFVIPALDKAVNDMMGIILEKAVKISVNTAEPIIKKDFSLDPEESHMRVAARNMVANMSSGMMLITGKEPLSTHLFNTLRTGFTQPLSPEMANTYKDLINQACGIIVQDNIELCMCFLQKNAIQRSIIELEKKLQAEFESRQRARAEGRVHYDQTLSAYQEKMPESIRMRVGSISPQQFSVYEEFGKNLPGFKVNIEDRTTTNATAAAAAVNLVQNPQQAQPQQPQPNFQVAEEMNLHYENLISMLRNELTQIQSSLLAAAAAAAVPSMTMNNTVASLLMTNLQGLIQAVSDFKSTQQPGSASNLVKKVVTNLLEGYTWANNEIQQYQLSQQQQQPQQQLHIIKSLSDPILIKYREGNVAVIKVVLNDHRFCVNNWIVREVQKIWIECHIDFKFCIEGLALLFKFKLLSPQLVDNSMTQLVETVGNVKVMQLAAQFLRTFFIDQAQAHLDVHFVTLLDTVSRLATISRSVQQNTDLKDLIEVIRINYDMTSLDPSGTISDMVNTGSLIVVGSQANRICGTALSMMYTGVQQARDFDDPPMLKEKSEQVLNEWIHNHYLLPQKDNYKTFQQFVLQMNSQGLFKTDDMITRFFRICTENCVDNCYFNLAKGQRQMCYQRLDAFVKLIILLVRHSGDLTQHANKINLFNKVLGLIAGCLIHNHEMKLGQFEPMPFHRLFYMLLFEATLPENSLDPIMFPIMQAFVNVFHIVRPTKVPGFAYSWLELVSHRLFLSKMLNIPGLAGSLMNTLGQQAPGGGQQSQSSPNSLEQGFKSWNMYAALLSQLVKFLAPFLRNIELNQSIMLLYKGTLRVFLVLLHDFPEFLCHNHYQFCDFIPPNCIQLRNLVLSAFPRCMKLPDPLTPNLKVDMIADIDSNPPKIAYPYIYNIPIKLKSDLDSYLKTRSPVTFLSDLRSYLQTSPETGSHYNIQLMNALVMYVGTNGIQALRAKGLTPTHNNLTHSAHSAHSDIFQSLVVYLDSEGRYLFINAVANQLRYPNSHTHYFGCALLNLFAEANSEAIQEQITRVLLERLIVNRPHPWGLLVTFIELIKNPQFKFWNHQFVHCAPEIEKMFLSLGKNCIKTN